LLVSCSRLNAPRDQGVAKEVLLAVKVKELKNTKIINSSDYLGFFLSNKSIDLYPKVSTYISEIHVKAGQKVSRDQLLFSFDSRESEARVKTQEANLDLIKNKLEAVQESLNSQKSEFEGTKAELEFEKVRFKRYNELYRKQLISKDQWNDRKKKLVLSKKKLDSSKAKLMEKRAEFKQIKSELEQKRYRLKAEQSKFSDYSLRATFDGIIGDIPVKQGNFVDSSTKLGSLINIDLLEIKLEIPVEKASLLDQESYLEIFDLRNQVLGKSKISFISPSVDKDSQTVLIKSSYKNKGHLLKDQQKIRTRIVWEEKKGLKIPSEAVKKEGTNSFVFVLKEINTKKYLEARKEKIAKSSRKSKKKVNSQFVPREIYLVHKTAVKLDYLDDYSYFVVSGLKENEKIVSSEIERLRDGFRAFDIKELETK